MKLKKQKKPTTELKISFKSFDFIFIEKALKQVYKMLFHLGLYNHNFIPLPTSRKLYTLLRSPHIDKKSREQFEVHRYKRQLCLKTKDFSKIVLFIYLLKHSDFPGIQIQISLNYTSFYI